MLSCVIYTTVINYVCIDYLAFEYCFKGKLPVNNEGGCKHETVITKYWELEIQIC